MYYGIKLYAVVNIHNELQYNHSINFVPILNVMYCLMSYNHNT